MGRSETHSYEALTKAIHDQFDRLSPGYRKIARFITQNPNAVALQSVNGIAGQCGVHASSLVRFAQSLGY